MSVNFFDWSWNWSGHFRLIVNSAIEQKDLGAVYSVLLPKEDSGMDKEAIEKGIDIITTTKDGN
jgi:hypothetical protein